MVNRRLGAALGTPPRNPDDPTRESAGMNSLNYHRQDFNNAVPSATTAPTNNSEHPQTNH